MNKEKLLNLIDDKINEVFLTYQQENDITSGDIDPLDALSLDRIKEELATLIERVAIYQAKEIPASFYVYRDEEGLTRSVTYDHIDADEFFCEISKRYAFDDCSGEEIIAIFWRGKEVQYVGWQPCMKFEYKDLNGNTVWVREFEEWDH